MNICLLSFLMSNEHFYPMENNSWTQVVYSVTLCLVSEVLQMFCCIVLLLLFKDIFYELMAHLSHTMYIEDNECILKFAL